MKKIILAALVFGFVAQAKAQDDIVQKRQNLEAKTMFYFTQIDDALNGLAGIKVERTKLLQDFQDSDFTRSDIKHMDAGMVGTALDFCVPTFQTTMTDAGNSGRNTQIIEQMRNGNR